MDTGKCAMERIEQIKSNLSQTSVLALYDPNMETKVAANVSSFGIGGVVLQLQPDDSWRPVSFILRAMTPTETRYAQIEKNALALTWACKRSWEYNNIYHGKVELCGNRLEAPGAVPEYSHTESTSTTNQKI